MTETVKISPSKPGLEVTNSPIDPSKPLIVVKDIVKKYHNKIALDNINLTINQGDRIGVIGANGCGKSTLSEIIAGIRQPTSGTITKQKDLVIGIQFQESRYPIGISGIDMIKYYLETFNIKMTESELNRLLQTYQIAGFENKFIRSLSGGQQQRLNILLSVIHNPDFVILDEVSTGLDIEVKDEIIKDLQKNVIERGIGMFLVSHNMNEIEVLCNKFIYMHNGKILESGMIADIVKNYGSVHNYTWEMFNKNKKADLKQQYQNQKDNHKNNDDYLVNSRDFGKNIPLIKLMLKYYYKGFFVPFFLLVYPILTLFLQGYAFKGSYEELHSLVASIAMVQCISVGIFIIPQTIIEFKQSVLMKRIAATNIKPLFFVLSVVVIGFIFVVLASFWTLLWAGILFSHEYAWHKIALPFNIKTAFGLFLVVAITSVCFGMMMAPLFKSNTSFIAVSNVIFIPIAALSGGLIPIKYIHENKALNFVSYFSPFKYSLDPFLDAWSKENFLFLSWHYYFLTIAIFLVIVFTVIAAWKLTWQN